jgi:pyridoxal phosphate enzyme (YggS family)
MIELQNYYELTKELAGRGVTLIAVSKTQPAEKIQLLYNLGHIDFGENKAQELLSKHSLLPADIKWHFIGHLQTNKVRQIVPFVSMIHSVDSFKLLREINKEAIKTGKIVNCLLQVYIAKEESKFGLDEKELSEILTSVEFAQMHHVKICGLMGMATFTDDHAIVRNEFKYLHDLFIRLKSEYFDNKPEFADLSMGMSDDYKISIEEGSTMIRVGTYIFGKRNYL